MPESDIFGPWTTPGTGGKSTTTTAEDPGATTPAIVDGVPFWDGSSEAYIQVIRPGPWNRCKLGGIQLPGVVTVTGKPRERKIDVKDAAGKLAAKITVKGWSPATLTIRCLIWTPTHLQDWRAARPQLVDAKGKSDAVDVENPYAEAIEVRQVIIKNPGAIDPGPKPGTKIITIECIENTAQPKTTGTGAPAKKNSGGTSGGTHSASKIKDAQNAYMSMGGDPNSMDDWLTFLDQNGLPHDYPPPAGYPSKGPPADPNPSEAAP